MEGSTIFLTILIALLAIKGLIGDSYRTPPMFLPQYPPSPRNPFGTTFAVIVGLVILISSMWLLGETQGQFSKPAEQNIDTAQHALPPTAPEVKTHINEGPARQKPIFFETSVASGEADGVDDSVSGRTFRDHSRACYFIVVAEHSGVEAGASLQRIFPQRNFQLVEISPDHFLTGAFAESQEAGREIVRDLNIHSGDLKRHRMRPRLLDLGAKYGVPVKAPGDDYWHCMLSQ